MDVHRCRFVPYPSSAINALAFSHHSSLDARSKPPTTLRLALGRANGDIEIWNPLNGAWLQEGILRGGKDRSIEGLAWVSDPVEQDKRGYKTPGKIRLFSIGYSQVVTEWDLMAGRPLRHSPGNYGEIWCMAAQPKDRLPQKTSSRSDEEQSALETQAQIQNIAVGCADGSIVLLSTAGEDLHFDRVLGRPSKKKTRVLSLTFQDRHTIVAGHADSAIRIYDVRGRQLIRTMTLGGGPRNGPKETLVWSVKVLRSGTIISGDSTGTVSFWDGKQYALLQRLKGHEADILDIAVSADGRSVFSGGMDRRVVQYRISGSPQQGQKARWEKSSHNRVHQNDVKTMATYEAKGFSVLAAGGLDTHIVIIPLQQYGREYHRTLPNLPQQLPMASASSKNLLASWWDRQVNIWSLPGSYAHSEERHMSSSVPQSEGRQLVAKIALQGEESITSADIATTGDLLVVSTTAETKIFRLRLRDGLVKVQKLAAQTHLASLGAKIIKFSPNKHWLLAVDLDSSLQLFRIVEDERSKLKFQILPKPVKLARITRGSVPENYLHGSLGSYDRSVGCVAFSSDSRILAVGDLSGYIDTWVLDGPEDPFHGTEDAHDDDASSSTDDSGSDEEVHSSVVFGQHWIRNPAGNSFPKLPTTPLLLSFRCSTNQENINIPNHSMPVHPTRHNPYPDSHDLPDSEDRLLVVTADNNLREFNVLAGKLSDWSRRNPHSCLPQEYRNLRDRAKGLIWDINNHSERVWVYGINWLWMFDLSQDLPLVKTQQERVTKSQVSDTTPVGGNLKRKRQAKGNGDSTGRAKLKNDTGAGSRMPEHDLKTSISQHFYKTSGKDISNTKAISVDQASPDLSDSEDDFHAKEQLALLSLRRDGTDGNEAMQDTDNHEDVGEDETDGRVARHRRSRPPFWHTYKYRPILGIVPLGGETPGGGTDGEGKSEAQEVDDILKGVEVALVERPLWDMDLPARYHGDQEWNP